MFAGFEGLKLPVLPRSPFLLSNALGIGLFSVISFASSLILRPSSALLK